MARKRESGIIGLDEHAFELLSRDVKAKEESNRVAQQTLTHLRLNNQLANDVVMRYAHLGEVVTGLIARAETDTNELQMVTSELQKIGITANSLLNQYAALTGIIREMVEELSRRFERLELNLSQRIGRLEDIELTQLAGQQLSKTDTANMITSFKREKLQRELQQHYINLAELRMTAARHGSDVPLNVSNSIRYEEETIIKLEEELHQ